MTDHAAFLSAICADPTDDTPRLRYADWLEEMGWGGMAEFIRLQIEHHPRSEVSLGVSNVYSNQSIYKPNDYEWREGDPYPILVGREPEPFELAGRAAMFRHWTLFGLKGRVTYRRGFLAEIHCTLQAWMGGPCPSCLGRKVVNLQGIMGRRVNVGCTNCKGTGTIPGHGPAIVAAHPVVRVAITDKRPHQSLYTINRWIFIRRGLANESLPSEVFDLLQGGRREDNLETVMVYRSEQAARDALECHAALAWAKQQNQRKE